MYATAPIVLYRSFSNFAYAYVKAWIYEWLRIKFSDSVFFLFCECLQDSSNPWLPFKFGFHPRPWAPSALCLLVLSADNLCKQFGPRSSPTKHRVWSGSKLFDTLMVFLKEFFKKVNFEKNKQTTKKHVGKEWSYLYMPWTIMINMEAAATVFILKAPPIICSRRQFKIVLLFQK